jgi:hypothetical protein
MSKYIPEPLKPWCHCVDPDYIKRKIEQLESYNQRIWKQEPNNRESVLGISKTYNAINKTIEEFEENNNAIILKLVEEGKEPVFLCLYFYKNDIDVSWSKIDNIILTKPLKRIQISEQTSIKYFISINEIVIWFDFEDGSTFYITASPKHSDDKHKSFECDYKILE